jgi:hypothetical protein
MTGLLAHCVPELSIGSVRCYPLETCIILIDSGGRGGSCKMHDRAGSAIAVCTTYSFFRFR